MKDPILIALIALVEVEKLQLNEPDVTLLVGGLLVSGFIVSASKYMKNHPATNAIWEASQKISSGEPEPADDSPNFIHLRDAKYYFPGVNPIPGNMSLYVRISLESVHGFHFGKLEVEQI